jgi:hypothetical protein
MFCLASTVQMPQPLYLLYKQYYLLFKVGSLSPNAYKGISPKRKGPEGAEWQVKQVEQLAVFAIVINIVQPSFSIE